MSTCRDSQSRQKASYIFFTTNLSLGTPPQPFRAVIDLNAMDLFVPSVSCGGAHCSDNTKDKYNASASSTFYENGTIRQKVYGPVYAFGIVGEETLRLGELEVPDQQFLELKYYSYVYPDEDTLLFDSVLGLGYEGAMLEGPPPVANILPSPFQNIVKQGLLDENKFGLQLPRDENHIGDLTFGGYNGDLVDGEFVSHPLFPEDTTYWQIEAKSMAMTQKEHGKDVLLFNETLSNYTASIWSTYPGILLPYELAQRALWKINYRFSPCTYQMAVDCDTVSSLPEIRFGFAGQDIVLKGEDYTMEIYENTRACVHPVHECWLMLESRPDRVEFPDDLIILGTSFLKNTYALFDWGKKSISCELVSVHCLLELN